MGRVYTDSPHSFAKERNMKKGKRLSAGIAVIGIALATALLATWFSSIVDEDGSPIHPASYSVQEETERQIDWGALPDEVIAWVEVPGTSIDEPIVQASAGAPNAYLRIDALGQGAYGTPYIDCDCSIDSRFVMVYGHHMSDGSVFADFANYIDEEFAREHDEIIVYRREGETLHLRPVAVDVVNASRKSLVIDQGADFDEMVKGSDLVLGEAAEDDQLFAFTTCSYQTRNSRTTVYAAYSSSEEPPWSLSRR